MPDLPPSPDPPDVRIVVFAPAAETSFRRYDDEMEGFDKAYSALATTLSIEPGSGWNTAGGYYEYLLANKNVPTVRVVYSFDDKEVLIRSLDAYPPR